MNAVIGIEDGHVIARLYLDNARYAGISIDYGVMGSVDKAHVLKSLEAQQHRVVEPWDLLEIADRYAKADATSK